jgi:hypothetical protein
MTTEAENWYSLPLGEATIGDELAAELHPTRYSGMSPRMAAIVGYLVDRVWTSPRIAGLAITSDGFLIALDGAGGSRFIGDAEDLDRNLDRLADAANLRPDLRAELDRRRAERVTDWRRAFRP